MAIRVTRGGLAAAAAVACLFACSKKGDEQKQSANEPAAAAKRRESAAQLAAPVGLFGHIPADTPYVFASFEPIPSSYWQKLAPFVKGALDSVPAADPSASPSERFALAFMRDLKANLDKGGLPGTLGIGAASRAVLYGHGIVPVMRLELADAKALLATVARVETESGVALPTASVGGRSYWRFEPGGDVLIIAAVAEDQLVVSAGPAAKVEKALPYILGVEQPSPNMADGGPLKAVAAQHGFSGYGVGYVDAQNLLKLLVVDNFFRGAGGADAVPPACMEQLTALSRRFPRLALGYDEFSDKRVAMRMVLETEPALAARLRELAVEVPGLVAGQPAERALLTVGLGVDLGKARALLLDAVDGIGRVGGACRGQDSADSMAGARSTLSQPLPPGVDKLRGVLISLLDGEVGPDRQPRGIEAYGIVASDDPAALLALLRKEMPSRMPDVAADGQFHDLLPAGSAPGLEAVRAAIKPRALVAAVGAKGAEAAERALARTGTSPLFYIAYDYAKIFEKFMAVAGAGAFGAAQKNMLSAFGMVSMWSYPSEQGLVLAMSMELK